MLKLKDTLAKSNPPESLTDHVLAVIGVWNEIKTRQPIIPFLNNQKDFWEQSFLSVLFHDFGKICHNFQDKITNKRKNYDNYIRHEFLSGLFLLFTRTEFYMQNPLSIIAIFSHHKPLEDYLFQDDSNKNLKLDNDLLSEFIDWCKIPMEINNISYTISEELKTKFNKSSLLQLYSQFSAFYKKSTVAMKENDRKEYIFYKAILNIADWKGSGHEQLEEPFVFTEDELKLIVCDKLLEEKKINDINSFMFREFQIKSQNKKNILALAPTGSGKTEAALLWTTQKEDYAKIIYCLPTRVTSNAIYSRLTKYFGEENTALIHSSALFFQKEIDEGYDKKRYLKDKTFFKNINICTIDQLLTCGFNLGYWEIKTFHLLNAKVIIDEIHLYDPYTLGLIIATIKYTQKEFNTQFYIMTATMPEKLRTLLLDSLAVSHHQAIFIEDRELLHNARNTFEIRENIIDELDDEVKEHINLKKKILIVVNTVDEAIRIYQKYQKTPDYSVICYHSRFIQKDKFNKENLILNPADDRPILLIATQVVEVSLDIDFDILFTENAPIDSLIQRAGRINRGRSKKDTKVIVFKHSEITEKYVYPLAGILDKTFDIIKENHQKKLSEKELLDLTDQAYENINIQENENYQFGLRVYHEAQEKLHFIKDCLSSSEAQTREGLDTINVIPAQFEEKVKALKDYEKVKYEISIRKGRYYSLDHSLKYTKDHFNFIHCHYNSDIGLSFTEKPTSTKMALKDE